MPWTQLDKVVRSGIGLFLFWREARRPSTGLAAQDTKLALYVIRDIVRPALHCADTTRGGIP